MKKCRSLLAVVLIVSLLAGCGSGAETAEDQGDTILATTYPMYYLTSRLTEGMEGVTVEQMVTEPVSCLHDYTLTTEQMKKIERADLIVLNGCGLEDFMADALGSVPEENILTAWEYDDPHCWLDPDLYREACGTICDGLSGKYPAQSELLEGNRRDLDEELAALREELGAELENLSCRELITFHDGFSWFAQAFDLTILASIEEEEGAEASAKEIQEICDLIRAHDIPAIFVEKNGSTNAAEIIARETGVKIYTLTTIMDGETDYFTAMEENVQAVKEALS